MIFKWNIGNVSLKNPREDAPKKCQNQAWVDSLMLAVQKI